MSTEELWVSRRICISEFGTERVIDTPISEAALSAAVSERLSKECGRLSKSCFRIL